MRILLISNMYPSEKDPLFGIFVKNFKSELEEQGVVFKRMALIKGKSSSVFKKLISYSAHYIRAIRHYFTYQYDLVYVHYLSHHIPLLFILVLFPKHPLVVNVHGSDIINLHKQKFLNTIARFILRRIQLLVVPTTYFRDVVIHEYPFVSVEKIEISPSGGIDGDKFYRKEKVSHDKLVLGFISRFIEEKGWRTFLEALVLLRDKNIPFKAILAGKGPDEEIIKSYIENFGLTNDVKFLGLVKQDVLVDVYNELDVYIFPTYREAESLGLTGLEAMSCGVPVIGCNIAGPGTYIDDGYNGYFFPPKNALALAEKVCQFYNLTNAEKEVFSQNALRTAASFDKTAIAKKLLYRLGELVK